MHALARKIVGHELFEYFIVGLILINAVILGLETIPSLVEEYAAQMMLINDVVLTIFVIEVVLKLVAVAPRYRLYFGDGWNLFDFTIVTLSLVPATGDFAMIARLARLLRIARLISTIPELRLIVNTLVRSIPSIGNVLLLMMVIFYIYAVAGYHLFHEHDPTHWRNLGISFLSLFRIATLEDWTDVMYNAMELHYLSWIFFVSFVVLGTFVVINLFIAVVLNNLDEAKNEQKRNNRTPPTNAELLDEIRQTQATLELLHRRLERAEEPR